jgi:Methyltransferase domain
MCRSRAGDWRERGHRRCRSRGGRSGDLAHADRPAQPTPNQIPPHDLGVDSAATRRYRPIPAWAMALIAEALSAGSAASGAARSSGTPRDFRTVANVISLAFDDALARRYRRIMRTVAAHVLCAAAAVAPQRPERAPCVDASDRKRGLLRATATPMWFDGVAGLMSMVELTRVIPDKPGRPEWGDAARPMQELTRAISLDRAAWTPERLAQIKSLFDSDASGWRDRDVPERHDALVDALTRGGPFPGGWCVEVGSGTGNATADLQQAFRDVVSLDLSREMLRFASFRGSQIQSDASALSLRTGSAAVVALINMFLFPAEISRVLADDGVLLWVSTNGEETPIYLPPADVLSALPGTWDGTTSQAGWGTWLTARRVNA